MSPLSLSHGGLIKVIELFCRDKHFPASTSQIDFQLTTGFTVFIFQSKLIILGGHKKSMQFQR